MSHLTITFDRDIAPVEQRALSAAIHAAIAAQVIASHVTYKWVDAEDETDQAGV